MSELNDFVRHRPRLLALAYRMLGSHADAEDIVQDAWLRWSNAAHGSIESSEAWLITAVTRLSIDRLRALRREREGYVGFWLPEPMVTADERTPEATIMHASDVSYAVLWMMERLSPLERAAFLLREVFDRDYAEIAAALDKSVAACRQLVHRASRHVRKQEPRYTVDQAAQRKLLEQFIAAAQTADMQSLQALVSAEAELVGDGGGKVPSFRHVLRGSEEIANLYSFMSRKYGSRVTYGIVQVNGMPGLCRHVDGKLESVQACVSDGTAITGLYVVRNPDKLANIFAADVTSVHAQSS